MATAFSDISTYLKVLIKDQTALFLLSGFHLQCPQKQTKFMSEALKLDILLNYFIEKQSTLISPEKMARIR